MQETVCLIYTIATYYSSLVLMMATILSSIYHYPPQFCSVFFSLKHQTVVLFDGFSTAWHRQPLGNGVLARREKTKNNAWTGSLSSDLSRHF